MRGWVYVITNKSMPDFLKVGFTLKDPNLRARELNSTGLPHSYVVEYEVFVEHPRRCEQKAQTPFLKPHAAQLESLSIVRPQKLQKKQINSNDQI